MIELRNLTKFYPSNSGKQYVFKDVNFIIPSGYNIAILGANGAGKSTLFRILSGSEYPNGGAVITDKKLSWPISFNFGIHPQMTGRENTRFIGRVNGVSDLNLYEEKVRCFSELDKKFDLLAKSYSSGMKSKLAFACCISIDFDTYLVDEAFSVGDQKFRNKAKIALKDKSDSSNLLMVSHNYNEIKEFCNSAILLNKNELKFYPDLEEAIDIYKKI